MKLLGSEAWLSLLMFVVGFLFAFKTDWVIAGYLDLCKFTLPEFMWKSAERLYTTPLAKIVLRLAGAVSILTSFALALATH
jgi:hypothetical protein